MRKPRESNPGDGNDVVRVDLSVSPLIAEFNSRLSALVMSLLPNWIGIFGPFAASTAAAPQRANVSAKDKTTWEIHRSTLGFIAKVCTLTSWPGGS